MSDVHNHFDVIKLIVTFLYNLGTLLYLTLLLFFNKGYDISFLITNYHCEAMYKHKLIDFVVQFIEVFSHSGFLVTLLKIFCHLLGQIIIIHICAHNQINSTYYQWLISVISFREIAFCVFSPFFHLMFL